jgi:hypothetical protein
MKILCEVNQAECLRHGVDAPSSTVKIDVDPKLLTEEQRNFVASQLCQGLKYPKDDTYQIAPPTYEGFIASVTYGIEYEKWRKDDYKDSTKNEELKQLRHSLIKTAIEKDLAENEKHRKAGEAWMAERPQQYSQSSPDPKSLQGTLKMFSKKSDQQIRSEAIERAAAAKKS